MEPGQLPVLAGPCLRHCVSLSKYFMSAPHHFLAAFELCLPNHVGSGLTGSGLLEVGAHWITNVDHLACAWGWCGLARRR
uniref:Uncharacterized protein n=1 Tax=Oryza sativa subsp. japonica TaxID=39947 RepID=Q67U73_ORYSJ|nr:hypothetical protein [Oryza sativa Japonica Group]BAD38298.1 hypothetical protein [Oryza sativa Japonica Group]